MRVLVFGGRNFGAVPNDTPNFEMVNAIRRARMQADLLYSVLDKLHKERPISLIIHGAAKGADNIGREWARSRRIPEKAFPANWDKHGRAAGPIRNSSMLREGLPDYAVGAPGGAGSADMLSKVREAGIEVLCL